MDVLVPFAATEPKTRLAGALGDEERAAFARAMLLDVCEAIRGTGRQPTVLSTDEIDLGGALDGDESADGEPDDGASLAVEVDDRPLTEAVNARLDPPVAVVMADLALATPAALRRLFETDGDVVIAPGLGGGTNALVVRHPGFRVDYHGASVRDHRRIAREVGAEATTVDSFRLAVDVDEPSDLAEVLLHGEGRAAAWLPEAGFEIETADGRVRATRRD